MMNITIIDRVECSSCVCTVVLCPSSLLQPGCPNDIRPASLSRPCFGASGSTTLHPPPTTQPRAADEDVSSTRIGKATGCLRPCHSPAHPRIRCLGAAGVHAICYHHALLMRDG